MAGVLGSDSFAGPLIGAIDSNRVAMDWVGLASLDLLPVLSDCVGWGIASRRLKAPTWG